MTPHALGWTIYGLAMAWLGRRIWRSARDADARHEELERRRQDWGRWP